MVNYCCWVILKFNKRDNEEIALNCAFIYFWTPYMVFLPTVYSQKIARSFCSKGHILLIQEMVLMLQGFCLCGPFTSSSFRQSACVIIVLRGSGANYSNLRIIGGRHDQPTLVFWLENLMDRGAWAGYSP